MRELKKEKHDGEKIASVWFPESVLDRVDRLAARGEISRSRLVRNLTTIGLENLETCEKFGILQTAIVLRDFSVWFKERYGSGIVGGVEIAK